MDLPVFLSTFGLVFLAELGDKTQLTAMALAMRFSWQRTFLGIAAAFAVLNLAAVVVGKILFTVLPLFWIKLVSGGLFLYFGIAALRGGGEETEEGTKIHAAGAIRTAFLMIFVAELGDKTQLVTASLAAQHDAVLTVFAGSTLALWSVSLLGIFVGRQLMRVIPLPYIHRGAAFLFLLFGGVILVQAFTGP
jgi:putative Ca2+/H+ antiporter (TMEM165/GDT1 family)